MTQLYLILALLLAILVAVFAVQNAERVVIHFLVWSFESSVVVVILVSAGLGALLAALIGLPQALRVRRRLKESEARVGHPAGTVDAPEGVEVSRGPEQ